MHKVEYYLNQINFSVGEGIIQYHLDNLYLFNKAKGSFSFHQAWEGGYRDHITQVLNIAEVLHQNFKVPYSFSDIIQVLYFHDIEKMYKYGANVENFDKREFLTFVLWRSYKIDLGNVIIDAIFETHGDSDENYKKGIRIGGLGAFCHACDILSARTFKDLKEI